MEKSEIKEPLFRFHSQNLSEGSQFWEGRAWFDAGRNSSRVEWCFGKRAHFLSAYIGIGGEDGITFHAGIPYLFALWFCFSLRFFSRFMPDDEYQTGITAHEEFIWINVWRNEMSSREAWLHWTFDWKTFFFGKQSYKNRVLNEFRSIVVMQEGDYSCTVLIEESTWKRPRWKAIIHNYATFKFDNPVPIPGKGENSWDLDDDAFLQMSVRLAPGQTITEAAKDIAAKIRQRRERYGGKNWLPE